MFILLSDFESFTRDISLSNTERDHNKIIFVSLIYNYYT